MIKGICMLSFVLLVLNVAAQERSFQLWNQNNVEVKINDKVKVGANEKIQYLTDSGNVNLKLGDIFVKKQFSPWLDMGLVGRLIWKKEENDWQQEYRPMIFGDLSAGLGRLNFEFSNRMEYRMFKVIDDYLRHRQRLTIETSPLNQASWLRVYLAEEVYYRFDEDQFHIFRLQTGSKIRYSNTFEMKLYYIFEKNRQPLFWNTSDILGLNLHLDF